MIRWEWGHFSSCQAFVSHRCDSQQARMSFLSKWEFNMLHHGDGARLLRPPLFLSSAPRLHRRLRVKPLGVRSLNFALQEGSPGSITAVNTTTKELRIIYKASELTANSNFRILRFISFLVFSCIWWHTFTKLINIWLHKKKKKNLGEVRFFKFTQNLVFMVIFIGLLI